MIVLGEAIERGGGWPNRTRGDADDCCEIGPRPAKPEILGKVMLQSPPFCHREALYSRQWPCRCELPGLCAANRHS
jgi:hypothetical protein